MRTLETVDRALRLLTVFDSTDERELTVTALASQLGIHRSSASRLAATLAQRGFLERAPDNDAFRLGPMLGRLGLLAIGERGLLSEARDVMERLAKTTGETVVLSMLDDGEAVDVAQATGSHLVGTRNWIGRRSPLHAASDGKVFLAFSDVTLRSGRLAAITKHTITNRQRLAEELQLIRGRGWASVQGDLEEGLNGVAAPVFDVTDRCAAALSVSGPAYRLPPERMPVVADQVLAATTELAARLGGVVNSRR
jgi:DNA-binding IclR family transcriptional regulator